MLENHIRLITIQTMVLPRLPNFHCPCGGASATVVDVAMGAAVAVDNKDTVSAVVPPSSTKDEGAYVGASVAFQGACVSAFADGAGESAAASVLLPPRCHQRAARRRRASRCRHRRQAAAAATPPPTAKLPPTSHCHAAATAAASSMLQSRCRHRAVRRRHASRYRHRR